MNDANYSFLHHSHIQSMKLKEINELLWQDELNPRVRCAFGNVLKLTLTLLFHVSFTTEQDFSDMRYLVGSFTLLGLRMLFIRESGTSNIKRLLLDQAGFETV